MCYFVPIRTCFQLEVKLFSAEFWWDVVVDIYFVLDLILNFRTAIYNDKWLKAFSTALIKQQWGQNLIKFDGMQLPGGVTLNGRQMYDDASGELEKLKEDIRLENEMPADFFVG